VDPAKQPREGYAEWRRVITESTLRRRPPRYGSQVDARSSAIADVQTVASRESIRLHRTDDWATALAAFAVPKCRVREGTQAATMGILLTFAAVLLLAVLVSGTAQRSVLSTALLFLVAGFILGNGLLGWMTIDPNDPVVSTLTELALFSVLFTDGMRTGIRDLMSAWRLPGRALFLGMPITLVGTALLAHLVVGLPWAAALLLGAVLSPTDPLLAAAIVGSEKVPVWVRYLLNVESGLNDGLALPLVLVLLHAVGGMRVGLVTVGAELALGVALGIVVPWVVLNVQRFPLFSPSTAYEPLNAFALGLLILALASLTQANLFLAAFTAGITVASIRPEVRDAFSKFGELVTELLKLAALLVFGALVSPQVLSTQIDWGGYVFAALALLVVRPVALAFAFIGAKIEWREWLAVSWFGPKGFASMIFGLLILKTGVQQGTHLFHLIALVIAGSIILHSSTDVFAVRFLGSPKAQVPKAVEGERVVQGD
jgi:NhaP-type Na+/H+ or K+/H+ antiporter